MNELSLYLPDISFDLREWEGQDFQAFLKASKSLAKLARRAGSNSDVFKKSSEKLVNAVIYSYDTMLEKITDPIDVRAFTFLLSSNDNFFSSVQFNVKLFETLNKVCPQLSRLALLQFIDSYFNNYTRIKEEESTRLGRFLTSQLACFDQEKYKGSFRSLAKHREGIFSDMGPKYLATNAVEQSIDLAEIIPQYGLTAYRDTAYVRNAQYIYYINTLETIPVGEDHGILSELQKKHVYESKYSDSYLIGHKIIEILIERSKGGKISAAWQGLILSIAGDPRVSETSVRYQRWWKLIPKDLIAYMRAWLSTFDLELFLQALEDSARGLMQSEVSRMFHSRKQFMEGLLRQKLITDSRLFLSYSAARYLTKTYTKEKLPDFAFSGSDDTSVIYLNISGIHMIEGSHQFRLHLMDRLPASLGIKNPNKKDFKKGLEGKNPDFAYAMEFGELGNGYFQTMHDPGRRWQIKAIVHLKQSGVNISPDEVLDLEMYRKYRSEYGVL